MTFNKESTTLNDYLQFIKHGLDADITPENELSTLKSLSGSYVTSSHQSYPSVFAFDNIGGVSYIVVRGGSQDETKLITVAIDDACEEDTTAESDESDHLTALQMLRGINLSEWYVLQVISQAATEHDSDTVLRMYGLSDLIPTTSASN